MNTKNLKVGFLIGDDPIMDEMVSTLHRENISSIVFKEILPIKFRLKRALSHGTIFAKALSVPGVVRSKLKSNYTGETDGFEINDNKSSTMYHVSDINGELTKARLEEFKPHVIIVHGTSIVKLSILPESSSVYNLHWGLSPYYRGSRCTEWALARKDFGNIGVTVHLLSKGIDSGDLVGQSRPDQLGNTVHEINKSLTRCGTDILRKIFHKHQTDGVVKTVRQNISEGEFYSISSWNSSIYKKAEHNLSNYHAGRTRTTIPLKDIIEL